jgi:hypothetical protein
VVQRTGQFFWAFAVATGIVLAGAFFYMFVIGRIEQVDWSKATSSSAANVGFGVVGGVLGGFVGFLLRPAMLVGQLPFETVLLRGANLRGVDVLLVPLAQTSFNMMVAGAIIGAVVGVAAQYLAARRNSGAADAGFGIVGGVLGGFVGFLLRPSPMLIGQLPFETVLLRGANLRGMDMLLVPVAQTSFNMVVAGAIIGAVVGAATHYLAIATQGSRA